MIKHTETQSVRLDKWLWAARFFKTRRSAAEAVTGGKVHVNGARAKPARFLNIGDQVLIRRGPYEWRVIVSLLDKRRGPAAQAVLLYAETEESVRQRESLASDLRAHETHQRSIKGRPTKRDRRDLLRFTGGRSGAEP